MTSNLKSPSSPTQTLSSELPSLNTLRITSPSSPDTSTIQGDGAIATDELERFRREWKQEVQAKHHGHAASGANGTSGASGASGWVPVGNVLWKEQEDGTAKGAKGAKGVKGAKGAKGAKGGDQDAAILTSQDVLVGVGAGLVGTGGVRPTVNSKIKSPVSINRALPPDLDEPDVGAGPSFSSSSATRRTAPPLPVPVIKGAGVQKPKLPLSASPERRLETAKVPAAAAASEGAASSPSHAVALYSRAVESEQEGKLNEALILYRKAFKLDDNVDRLYARSVAKAAALAPTTTSPDTPTSTDVVSSAAPADEPYSFQRHIQVHPDYERAAPSFPIHPSVSGSGSITTSSGAPIPRTRPSQLSSLLQALPIPADHTTFLPSDETLPTPIASLPPELLDPVLSHLDVASIERFALTCWRARYLTASATVWKRIAEGIYKGPAMVPDGWNARDLARRHAGEWRTTLVEEERIRMDGCYISVCHYIRPGAGEQWVTITHMITYHRFLRFYPDGTVISFLTTDHPSEVVPLLRPTLRAKGLHFGNWRLLRPDSPEYDDDLDLADSKVGDTRKDGVKDNTDNTDNTDNNANKVKTDKTDETDKTGKNEKTDKHKRRAKVVITDLLEPGAVQPKYEFEMELELRETGRGRWNKLDILRYHSINLATGESLGLSLKHQKPFYFSKVKSYNPQL